jgi:transcriptional regulator with XRE-family HTH domain
VHDLIGRGFADARRDAGLTQEQAARRLQSHGLTAWRTSTVGSLEAGLRKPRLDEVLLMAAALHVTVDQLIPGGDDERVELGEGAVVSPRWIREMLTGELYRHKGRPAAQMPPAQFPVQEVLSRALRRAGAERDRQRALIQPILDRLGLDQWSEEVHRVFLPPTDAEVHAARRLKVEPVQVKAASLRWEQDFEAERDSRVGGVDELEPRSRQARRGLVTRDMLAELRVFLNEAYGAVPGEAAKDDQDAPGRDEGNEPDDRDR